MDLHVVLNYCKGSQSLAKNRNTHESSGQAAPNAYTTFTGLADLARSLYMKYIYIYTYVYIYTDRVMHDLAYASH